MTGACSSVCTVYAVFTVCSMIRLDENNKEVRK